MGATWPRTEQPNRISLGSPYGSNGSMRNGTVAGSMFLIELSTAQRTVRTGSRSAISNRVSRVELVFLPSRYGSKVNETRRAGRLGGYRRLVTANSLEIALHNPGQLPA